MSRMCGSTIEITGKKAALAAKLGAYNKRALLQKSSPNVCTIIKRSNFSWKGNMKIIYFVKGSAKCKKNVSRRT